MRVSGEKNGGGDDESGTSVYRVLVDRCASLEASHAKLKQQLSELTEADEKRKKNNSEAMAMSDAQWGCIPGYFTTGSPYKSVLDCIGHAVHVCRASSGEIVYWNRSAENLYGWKDSEVIGQSATELLVAEDHYAHLKKIMERLSFGQSWSGRFPFKKRSGDLFMALVTKSPLYEEGELAGIVTVSSDAAIFNTENSQNRARLPRLNLKKIQWNPRPPIAPVTQIASSVSNLAPNFLARKHGDDTCNEHGNSWDKGDTATDMRCFRSEIPGEPAAKILLAKLNIKGIGNIGKHDDASAQQNGPRNVAERNEAPNGTNDLASSKASSSYHCNNDAEREISQKINSSSEFRREYSNAYPIRSPNDSEENFPVASSTECNGRHGLDKPGDQLQKLVCQQDRNELELEASNLESNGVEDDAKRQPDGNFPSNEKSVGSLGGTSSKRDRDSNCIVDCEIHWEDLQLGEEIGRGAYAAVRRGIWNGSDVAVKIYFGNQYKEETLLDYQKEIDIMKRLRHPNVLLFMGAVYSPERLAIVTEFLPRGSLFKTLHKNSPALDIRRRLKMALDVARGMNYLHHRNPPIVHRDLKSSNLLVDKNWTVKVGDFGLSKWMNATFLTAKSGRGTPQWMAPEVLRNEPSNENVWLALHLHRSDVFSFGVILWELMAVSIPWVKLNSLQIVGVVGFMDRRLELPESLDPKVASIINDCWRSDPEQRPSFEEIIQRMAGDHIS
uniref:non-specific serine/threonine protein kinase n=1 Tax=Populus trichocarpa TaxID=3694 RepID=B9GW76_POPTR